ncbi:MAG: acetate kinase [Clostridiaceae bacterium]|nr:acetate kinase [Clostridiaceae bacterium]
MNVFVLNAGSSSLKYRLYRMEDQLVLAEGGCERIGIDGRIKYASHTGFSMKTDCDFPTHEAAFTEVIRYLTTGDSKVIDSLNEITAIGHRVVHGGVRLVHPMQVTMDVIEEIERNRDFAPLHSMVQAGVMRICLKLFGTATFQVVVFDTGFHQTMPPEAFLFGLPYHYYKDYGIRRYGFHGISHNYVSERAAKLLNRDIAGLKMVSCHLGNGSSICAIDGGRSVDCSMGFGPVDGIIMGTRSGQVDPTALFYIAKKDHLNVDQLSDMISKQSGVLGISGISSDDRDIEDAMLHGNEQAALTRGVQCYQIRKYIGSYSFVMGRLDVIIFTAGLGENSATLRAAAVQGMENFGVVLDPEKNRKIIRGKEGDISADGSPVRILVIPTNEELKIALDTVALMNK